MSNMLLVNSIGKPASVSAMVAGSALGPPSVSPSSSSDPSNPFSDPSDPFSALSGPSSAPSAPSSPSGPSAVGPSSGKSYSTMDANFFNYADMYSSPYEINNLPQNLVGYYTTALLSGGASAQPIYSPGFSAENLPGNRYFIDTQTQCQDASGQIHDRSILIDNVLKSNISENKSGLMYSLFASLGNISTSSPTPSPSPSPGSIQTATIGTTLPTCQYVQVKPSDNSTANIGAYVNTSDFNNIDQLAITEGFGPFDQLQQTMAKATSYGETSRATITSTIKSKQEDRDSQKQQAQIQGRLQRKSALLTGYYKQYGSMPMSELFSTFLTYDNINEISPTTIYNVLSNTQLENTSQMATNFIDALKQSAQLNETNNSSFKLTSSNNSDILTNFTNNYIPESTIPGFDGIVPTQMPNPEYVNFWNALEIYRTPIIDSLAQTDHPNTFPTAEGFTNRVEYSYCNREMWVLFIILAVLILGLIVRGLCRP